MTYVDPSRTAAAKDRFRQEQASRGISVDAQGMTTKADGGKAKADDPFFRLSDGSTWFDENVAANQHQGTSADPIMATNKRIAEQVRSDSDHYMGQLRQLQTEGFDRQRDLHNLSLIGQSFLRSMG